jgi:hypothetical protein
MHSATLPGMARGIALVALLTAHLTVPATQTAHAEEPAVSKLTGTWAGSYVCPQGETGVRVSIASQSGSQFSGTFHFFPLPSNGRAKEGCYRVRGEIGSKAEVTITAIRWISQPEGYVMVGLQGLFDAKLKTITGDVVPPADVGAVCTTFQLVQRSTDAAVDASCETSISSANPSVPKFHPTGAPVPMRTSHAQ